ncbi:MAG: hypothetical protein OXI41_02810 [Chloroflexota bacterium]|nr:hypothetical protein [Chloroflexota bacterium]MDE2895218.1 hypothetical protein [Chloroflexota bacterium]
MLVRQAQDEGQQSPSVIWTDHHDSGRLSPWLAELVHHFAFWLIEVLRRPAPHLLGINEFQAVPP